MGDQIVQDDGIFASALKKLSLKSPEPAASRPSVPGTAVRQIRGATYPLPVDVSTTSAGAASASNSGAAIVASGTSREELAGAVATDGLNPTTVASVPPVAEAAEQNVDGGARSPAARQPTTADGSSAGRAAGSGPAPSPVPAAPLVRGSARMGGRSWDEVDVLPSRITKMQRMLEGRQVELEQLRQAAWAGVPARYRIAVWQMLLGYLPLNRDRQVDSVARKQAEYQQFVQQFCSPRGSSGMGMSDSEATLLRQVLFDVKRTSPDVKLMQEDRVQRSLERVLFIFARRHFATGYVQGINDLATPFFAVFLSEWADPDTKSLDECGMDDVTMMNIEADVYWCLSRLIEGMQDHYMPSQPGIQRMIHQLRELVHRMDEGLVTHLEANSVEFHTFAFRWMNCLLLRELPLKLVIRLWDTYLSETKNSIKDGFGNFHVFVCAALLLKFRQKLKEMTFQDLLQFLHNLPTKDWTYNDVQELLSQAYVYMTSFEGSPSHLK